MTLKAKLKENIYLLRQKGYTIANISKAIKISKIKVMELMLGDDQSTINTEYTIYLNQNLVIPCSDTESIPMLH